MLHRITSILMCIAVSLFVQSNAQQLVIQVNISSPNGANTTIDQGKLNSVASSQGAGAIIASVSQSVDTQLTAQQCQQGTYSQTVNSAQTCVNCAAGTASSAVGASDSSTCVPCTTGSFSLEKSATCTDCGVNTFSVTPAGPSPSVCLQCPPYTTSPTHSSSVDSCVCNAGFFQSDNVLKAFPYDYVPISIDFSGAFSINFPHVSC